MLYLFPPVQRIYRHQNKSVSLNYNYLIKGKYILYSLKRYIEEKVEKEFAVKGIFKRMRSKTQVIEFFRKMVSIVLLP